MGWVEMRGWLEQMNRQRTPEPGAVDRWDQASEQSFAEMRAAARAGRGFAQTG